jgi:hypothetical protein
MTAEAKRATATVAKRILTDLKDEKGLSLEEKSYWFLKWVAEEQ